MKKEATGFNPRVVQPNRVTRLSAQQSFKNTKMEQNDTYSRKNSLNNRTEVSKAFGKN